MERTKLKEAPWGEVRSRSEVEGSEQEESHSEGCWKRAKLRNIKALMMAESPKSSISQGIKILAICIFYATVGEGSKTSSRNVLIVM